MTHCRTAAGAEAFASLCAGSGHAGGFVTLGLMAAGGEPLFLCEGGQSKVPSEHRYVFYAVRPLVADAFKGTFEAQREYGSVFPEFAFAKHYVSVAEAPIWWWPHSWRRA